MSDCFLFTRNKHLLESLFNVVDYTFGSFLIFFFCFFLYSLLFKEQKNHLYKYLQSLFLV